MIKSPNQATPDLATKEQVFHRNSSSVIHNPCQSQQGHVSRILTLITYAALLRQLLT